jgi:hypothetical protein
VGAGSTTGSSSTASGGSRAVPGDFGPNVNVGADLAGKTNSPSDRFSPKDADPPAFVAGHSTAPTGGGTSVGGGPVRGMPNFGFGEDPESSVSGEGGRTVSLPLTPEELARARARGGGEIETPDEPTPPVGPPKR